MDVASDEPVHNNALDDLELYQDENHIDTQSSEGQSDIDIIVTNGEAPEDKTDPNTSQTVANPNREEWILYDINCYVYKTVSYLDNKYFFSFNSDKRVLEQMRSGMRSGIGCLLLCHHHYTPHILLFQRQNKPFEYRIPSFRAPNNAYEAVSHPCSTTEKFIKSKISKITASLPKEKYPNIVIGEQIGIWWRTEHGKPYVPILPPHVTRPAEKLNLYQVTISPCAIISSSNFAIKAVPVFDLNIETHGVAIGTLPGMLSRSRYAFFDRLSG